MTGSDAVRGAPAPHARDDRSRVRPLRTLLRYAVVAAVGSTVVTVVAAMIADSTQPDLWLSALVGLVAIVGSFSLICSIAAAVVSTGCVVALTADRGVIFLAALVTFFVVELLVIRPYSVAAAVSFFSVLPAASAAASIALAPPSRAPADVGARPGTPRTDP